MTRSTKVRILFVDDCSIMRTCIKRCFRKTPSIELVEAEDGRSAILEAARGPNFDLILTNLRMPLMNGFELFDLLRSRGIETPVWLITGDTESDVESQARKRGIEQVFLKSEGEELLIERVLEFANTLQENSQHVDALEGTASA